MLKQHRGRPSKFTKTLAGNICSRPANGESLRGICHSEDMLSRETVRRWLRDDVDFHAQAYRRAYDAENTKPESV